MSQITLELLADVLGTTAGELADALKDGEELKSEQEIKDHLRNVVDERIYQAKKEVQDQFYSRGKREALTKLEKRIREEYGLSGSNVDELLKEMEERTKQKPNMTPEDVRNTEIYKIDIGKLREAVTQAEKQANSAKSEYEQKLVNLKLRSVGHELLGKHKFVLPDGIADQGAWFDLLINRMESGDARIGLNDQGELQVLDQEGQPKMDARLNPITFEDHFTEVAGKLFKKAASDDRKSPQTKPGAGGPEPGEGGEGGAAPTNEQEFLDGVAHATGVEAKKAYIAKYGAQFGVN